MSKRVVWYAHSKSRPVGARDTGGAMAPLDFGRSVNPISTRGGWLYPPQYYLPPRIFDPCCIPEPMNCEKQKSRNTILQLWYLFRSNHLFFLWQPTTVFWCLVEFEQLWWKICRSLFLLLPHSFTELLTDVWYN